MDYDLSIVVTIIVTCYSWAPSSGDHLFTCGAIYPPPHMQYQFVCKKQTVHPTVPNSDTLVNASETVYPIHIDQSSSDFLGEDHISYCTTVPRARHFVWCNFFRICYILPN